MVKNDGLRQHQGDQIRIGDDTTYGNKTVGPIKLTNPNTGKQYLAQAEFYSQTDEKTGKKTIIGGSYFNTFTGKTAAFYKGKNGSIQHGVSEFTTDAKGTLLAGNFKSLTHAEINKGGYATDLTIDGALNGGVKLYEKNIKGQNTKEEDTFVWDRTKENRASILGGVVPEGQDLTTLTDKQIAALVVGEAVNKALEGAGKVAVLGKIPGAGKEISMGGNADFKDFKANWLNPHVD